MRKFKDIEEFKDTVLQQLHPLEDVRDYLNDAGLGKAGALRAVYYHACFEKDFKGLSEDEDFISLMDIPDQHPEYYRTLRMINRVIEYNKNS